MNILILQILAACCLLTWWFIGGKRICYEYPNSLKEYCINLLLMGPFYLGYLLFGLIMGVRLFWQLCNPIASWVLLFFIGAGIRWLINKLMFWRK